MNVSAHSEVSGALTESQKAALLTLLTDEDPEIHRVVRSRILACGLEALRWLRPHALSSDPVLRRRVQEIVQHLARQDADNRFLVFCVSHGENLDLEAGVWLLAQTQYPEINAAAYQALLDSYAADLRERLVGRIKPLTILAEINDYLFEELHFRGDQENPSDPDDCYFNRVIDRRLGNPISLCTLYWLIGHRLKLPIVGIGMPGHFLCRYQTTSEAFFVDVFHRGRLLTRTDCVRYLQQSGHGFQEGFLAPISPGRTLLRLCSKLHKTYSQLGLAEETARLQRYVVALAK